MMPYQTENEISSFNLVNISSAAEREDGFASELCVAAEDIKPNLVDFEEVSAGALFDLKGLSTIYAKNVNSQLHPASLTKVMTALVAMKNGTLDQMLTASDNVVITEAGAQVCGLKAGDQMTLDQALHILLIYSANDVAVMIAENIGGSVEGFTQMMNEEAMRIGATGSHFLNPNGLTQDGHYVTAYDMYLIFNEALKFNSFSEIIQMSSYSTVYYSQNGTEIPLEIDSTNLYLRGDYNSPGSVTVIGGKTGTTNAAGHCLILYSKNSSGNPYISVVMNAPSREELYGHMTDLLGQIP